MILGIGVDIELIEGFKKTCSSENFINLVFSKREIDYCMGKSNPAMHFAGKFTAKEAIIKAFPAPLNIQQIEIINGEGGMPRVYIDGNLDERVKCSISHTTDYAVSSAIVQDVGVNDGSKL